jgi:hypothetical protein
MLYIADADGKPVPVGPTNKIPLDGGGGSSTVTSNDITDATAVGKQVLTAASTAAARTAIGAGTSNLAIGTTSTSAKAGDYAPPLATTAAAGTVKMAATQANSTATDVAGLVTDLNALLAKLKAAGIMA